MIPKCKIFSDENSTRISTLPSQNHWTLLSIMTPLLCALCCYTPLDIILAGIARRTDEIWCCDARQRLLFLTFQNVGSVSQTTDTREWLYLDPFWIVWEMLALTDPALRASTPPAPINTIWPTKPTSFQRSRPHRPHDAVINFPHPQIAVPMMHFHNLIAT